MKRFSLAILFVSVACSPSEPDLLDGQPQQQAPVVVELPPIEGAPPPAPVAPQAALSAEQSDVTWQTPAGWEEQAPANTMRAAQWASPDGIECALFHFPGGGSVDDNIARWIGQFEQPDGGDSMERAERMGINVDGVDVTLVRVAGTFVTRNPPMTGPVERQPDYGMFAAIFQTRPAPYFLKCTGPAAAVTTGAAAISGFVASFRFPTS